MNLPKISLPSFVLGLAAFAVLGCSEADTTKTTPSETVSPTGWTQNRFDTFTKSRAGDGDPVYWYSVGTLRGYPGGELLYTLEGYDTATGNRVSPTRVEQYSRKIYIYRDAKTGEIVKNLDGTPLDPIAYPYQFITYELTPGGMKTFVEQGREPNVQKIGPGTDMTVRQIGDMEIYTAPLFLDFPIPQTTRRYQTFENYDFVIPQDLDRPGLISFVRYGPLPQWAVKEGRAQGAMHMTTWRISDFADVPESFRDFVKTQAPMWSKPPADFDEIRSLQAPISKEVQP